jgi:hypothetical protein
VTVPATRHGLLGKKDPVRLEMGDFKSYFPKALPAPPPQAHYGGRVTVPWGMDANGPDPSVTIPGVPEGWDGCGDCVVAGLAHSLTIANFEEGKVTDPVASANTCVETYCQLLGCTTGELFDDPEDYDNGLDIASSLQAWNTSGLFGVKLGALAPVNYQNMNDVKSALYLGGVVVIGIQVQQAQEDQFPHTWRWVPGSPILGGHCIILTGYTTAQKLFWGVTWGALIDMTEDFLVNAMDEAFAVVSAQAIKDGKGPTGLNIAQLEADLKQL